eukprot:3197257-Rhodomonas_salina.4
MTVPTSTMGYKCSRSTKILYRRRAHKNDFVPGTRVPRYPAHYNIAEAFPGIGSIAAAITPANTCH